MLPANESKLRAPSNLINLLMSPPLIQADLLLNSTDDPIGPSTYHEWFDCLLCMCVCENADIFRRCERLKMQTGLYVTQWPARSAPQSNLSSLHTSQPCVFPVCSQIMLSELITAPDPRPHFDPLASPTCRATGFPASVGIKWGEGNRDACPPSSDPHPSHPLTPMSVCLSWPDCNTHRPQY